MINTANNISSSPGKKISLLQATAINMIDMVGIGPFVVLSLVAEKLGNQFLYAWILGAVLSFTDAMVWSQLGATYPLAGGSYNFLKQGFGPKYGKLLSFLYVWQTMIQAPLVIASAAIGFAQYFCYLIPLNTFESKAVSGGMVVLIVTMLYRKIETIGKLSVLFWIGVLGALFLVIGCGIAFGNFSLPLQQMNNDLEINNSFAVAIGFASVKTVYSYLGYYNVCHIGGEIKNPQINIPRSMFISITGISILYLLMNISVAAVLPMHTIQHSKFVISEFFYSIGGNTTAKLATGLILWVAFASVFSATLGYSRVPYAAAIDGAFFKVFAKLHPTKNFPYVSLLVIGSIAFVFSLLFKLKDVIDAILAMRILIQFIGQSVGLLILTKQKGLKHFAWQMPLYPLPVIAAILIWSFIFFSTGIQMMLGGLIVTGLGCLAYFIMQKFKTQ